MHLIELLLPMLDFDYSKRVKVRNENVINDLREELDKGNIATSKLTVSSVIDGVCTRPSNVI